MQRVDITPDYPPTKRPFRLVIALSAEELAINFAQKMDQHNVSLKDVLCTLFASKHPDVLKAVDKFNRYGGAATMVKIWASGCRKYDRGFVQAATKVVVATGASELKRLSKIQKLRHPANAIDLDKIENFKLDFIGLHLQQSAPTVLDVITGLASVNKRKKPSSTIVMMCSIILFLRSQQSNHFQMMMGLYLYSCGCPSAVMDILAKAAISVSRTSVQKALKGMTEDALQRIRKDVRSRPWFLVYDNINFASRKFDQRIDNADSFENGTTATVVMMDEYITSDSIEPSYRRLCLENLIPSAESVGHMVEVMERSLIGVLARASEIYEKCCRSPPTLSSLTVAKTIVHPLPSMHIDQASVAGNLEVLNTIMEKTLRLRQDWFETDRKILVAGDQLTVSRVSRAMDYKSVDISPYHRVEYALPFLQLFHLQLAFCGMIVRNHWGSVRQTGSLLSNKHLLRRKRVSLTKFDYHAADELLRHTFEAIVRRIWEVALEHKDVTKAAEGMDDQQIQELVLERLAYILDELLTSSPAVVHRFSGSNRNMALLLRHIITYLELSEAIKAGDIGRIEGH